MKDPRPWYSQVYDPQVTATDAVFWGAMFAVVLFIIVAVSGCGGVEYAYMSDSHYQTLCYNWKGKHIKQMSKMYPVDMFKIESLKDGRVKLTATLQGVLGDGSYRYRDYYSYSLFEVFVDPDGVISHTDWRRVYSKIEE